MTSLIQRLGWSSVAALTADGEKYTDYMASLQVLGAQSVADFRGSNFSRFSSKKHVEIRLEFSKINSEKRYRRPPDGPLWSAQCQNYQLD